MNDGLPCPCDSTVKYNDCCQPYHNGISLPLTAEALMRSRYSAYALKLVDYLVDTTHRDKLKSSYRKKLISTIHDIEWIGLEIIKKSAGTSSDKVGKVSFKAKYKEFGEKGEMTENSRFKKLSGRWYYYDGKG